MRSVGERERSRRDTRRIGYDEAVNEDNVLRVADVTVSRSRLELRARVTRERRSSRRETRSRVGLCRLTSDFPLGDGGGLLGVLGDGFLDGVIVGMTIVKPSERSDSLERLVREKRDMVGHDKS